MSNSANKQPLKVLKPKVVCIGLNKTGTTSFGTAISWLGYKRLGWRAKLSTRLIDACFNDGIKFVLNTAKNWDAFEDIPWPLVYKEMDEEFPNAKFVLTIRKTPEIWLDSITRHIGSDYEGHKRIYGYYKPNENPKAFLNKYITHNAEVAEYFKDRPDKLLTMCFEDGDGWDKLLPFLGLKGTPLAEWPHKNKGRIKRKAAKAAKKVGNKKRVRKKSRKQ